MNDSRPTLEELITDWKERLRAAEQQLECAREEVRKRESELRSGSMPSPDLHYAFQSALRAETLALEKYARVLMIFNDLVLQSQGRPPSH